MRAQLSDNYRAALSATSSKSRLQHLLRASPERNVVAADLRSSLCLRIAPALLLSGFAIRWLSARASHDWFLHGCARRLVPQTRRYEQTEGRRGFLFPAQSHPARRLHRLDRDHGYSFSSSLGPSSVWDRQGSAQFSGGTGDQNVSAGSFSGSPMLLRTRGGDLSARKGACWGEAGSIARVHARFFRRTAIRRGAVQDLRKHLERSGVSQAFLSLVRRFSGDEIHSPCA